MQKYTKNTATHRFDLEKNRGSINISANPISEMKTTEVVIGINLQVNKSVAKKLFFLFEDASERLQGELHMLRSTNVEDISLPSEGNLQRERQMNESCESIQDEISMYMELRNRVLTALIGEQE